MGRPLLSDSALFGVAAAPTYQLFCKNHKSDTGLRWRCNHSLVVLFITCASLKTFRVVYNREIGLNRPIFIAEQAFLQRMKQLEDCAKAIR